MAHARRLTALVMGVLMLTLVFVESGFACAMPEMADMNMAAPLAPNGEVARGTDGMDGMPMPATQAPEPGGHEDEAPCRFPWAPSGCRDMAPCAPATLAVAAWVPPAAARVHDALSGGRASALASFDTSPEPPPPRA